MVMRSQLPADCRAERLSACVENIRGRCASILPQKAARLAIGHDLDSDIAVASYGHNLSWRDEFSMDAERARVVEHLHSGSANPHHIFPHHAEVCEKCMVVTPCALLSADGCPVTIFSVTSPNQWDSVEDPDSISCWSRSVFEYLDALCSETTLSSGKLLGHYLVFDIAELSWSHVSSGQFIRKVQDLLSGACHHTGMVFKIFILNATSLFTVSWSIARPFLSDRTAARVCVVPSMQDMCAELGLSNDSALEVILMDARQGKCSNMQLDPCASNECADSVVAKRAVHFDSFFVSAPSIAEVQWWFAP